MAAPKPEALAPSWGSAPALGGQFLLPAGHMLENPPGVDVTLVLRRSLNAHVRVDNRHFGPHLGMQKLVVIQMISKR